MVWEARRVTLDSGAVLLLWAASVGRGVLQRTHARIRTDRSGTCTWAAAERQRSKVERAMVDSVIRGSVRVRAGAQRFSCTIYVHS